MRNEVLGPQVFVAQDRSGHKRNIRVNVRRETTGERRARQLAFAVDKAYIKANLKPGKPVYAKTITLGA